MDMGMAELADTKHDLLRPSVSIKESSGFISGAVVRLVLDSQARPARGPNGPGTDTGPGTEAGICEAREDQNRDQDQDDAPGVRRETIRSL